MQEKARKKVGREKEYYKDYRKTLTYAENQLRYWQRKIEELGCQEKNVGQEHEEIIQDT